MPIFRFRFAFAAPTLLGLALLALAATGAIAQQQVYRSVDDQGRVTFSAEPPRGADVRSVETLTIAPGPSEAQQAAARARAADMERAANPPQKTGQSASGSANSTPAGKASSSSAPQPGPSSNAQPSADVLVDGQTLTPQDRARIDQVSRQLRNAKSEADAAAASSSRRNRDAAGGKSKR